MEGGSALDYSAGIYFDLGDEYKYKFILVANFNSFYCCYPFIWNPCSK